jgi:sulfate adenylyltransferase subunit 1 (EFTu-like GTPase family)
MAAAAGATSTLRVIVAGGAEDDGTRTLVARLLGDAGGELSPDGGAGCFSTARRTFRVTDADGQGEPTRAMVTEAAVTDLAVLVVDARSGIGTATRRQAYLAGVLGLGQVVLAVDQLDLVDDAAAVFARMAAEFRRVAGVIGLPPPACTPS